MDWTQAITIIGVFIGGFFFLMTRMDSNKKELDQKMDSNKKELDQKMDSNKKELDQKMDAKFDAVNTRFNALENRLTAMEVEIKSTNQRLSNIESCVMPRKVFHFEESHKEDPEEPKEN